MAQASPTAQPQPADQTPTQTQQTQAPQPDDHGLLAALVLILGASVTASAAEGLVASALAPIGVGAQAAAAAYRLAMAASLPVGTKGPASAAAAKAATSWRAAYLLAAAKRLARGVASGDFRAALATERRYALAHRDAQRNRLAVAQRIDALVADHGDTLEWRCHRPIDNRVTPECLAADRHLFSASHPPAIGLPGAAHARCRCYPVAPTSEARIRGTTVDEAVIAAGAR